MKSSSQVRMLSLLVSALAGLAHGAPSVSLGGDHLERIEIQQPALYPETILYDPGRDRFLAGSLRDGAIYEVALDGSVRKLFDDESLKSTLGIALDSKRGRLLALSSDVGVSTRSYPAGPNQLASLEIFELSSGKHTRSIDLGGLVPGRHLANGIALDTDGNAYITDSFSPVIYRVDPEGRASVFLESDKFKGEGINLNGIVAHPDGYLIVVKKSDGTLFRVPIAAPQSFEELQTPLRFPGGDGLLLLNPRELVVVANSVPGRATETVFSLVSDNGWRAATVAGEKKLGDVYPTTGVARNDKLYVVHSHIGKLLKAPKEEKASLRPKAVIEQVGTVRATSEPITRTLLESRAIAEHPGWETRLYLIEYAPGAEAPTHRHPFVGLGYVLSGRFESAFGDGPLVTVVAGQSFVDTAGVEHRVFRNPDPSAPLRFLVTYSLPVGRAAVEF